MNPLILIGFGILVGVFSGLMGLGGGAIMVPIMVFALGFAQVKAHGMSLMVMVPPVALLAVFKYFRDGHLQYSDISTALLISLGVFLGGYCGAGIADMLAKHKGMLAMIFGLLLVYVAMYTALGKDHLGRSVVLSLIVTVFAAAVVFGAKWYDARNDKPAPIAAAEPVAAPGAK